MKKILLIFVVSLGANLQINAQLRDTSLNIDTYKVEANLLFQKSKNQKTVAWILLGSGIGLVIAGSSIIAKDAQEELAADLTTIFSLGLVTPEKPTSSAAGPILAYTGTAAMLGSIPLFLAGGKNKKKANLMIKKETVFFSPELHIKEHLLSAGLKINL